MDPGVTAHLVQDKARNICSRYGPAVEAGEIRERADFVAGLIVEDGGTNEDPIEPATSDDGFLPVLVGVHLAQQKRENQIVEQKSAVTSAVTGSNPCDADQTRDLLGLHRAHERPRRH